MKKLLLLLVLALPFAGAEDLGLRAIFYDEVVGAGEQVPVFVSVRNSGGGHLDRVKVTVSSPDIDVFRTSNSQDIRRNRASTFVVPLDIPGNTPGGLYYLRFRVTDDEQRSRTYYRHIIVR